ncbi:AMIN-like domain-containing (lipo)protein [Ornithinimicrobium sp. W1679]|uniref:AMIN-like domain-containing (lipo)protein n=1 Tax=unclassified Ornithinimicrobium TaxID=2615080 RepID=UPI003CF20637
MNERYDVDGTGRSDGGGLDVRELLEEASWGEVLEELDVDGAWRSGRRRRTLRRVAAGTLAGTVAASVLVLGWQAGALVGPDPQGPTVAAVPDGWTTFVLAAPEAPTPAPAVDDAVAVPEADALRGSTWELLPDLHGGGTGAQTVVPASRDTTFSFAEEGGGWGFEIAGCGGGWFSQDLDLDDQGRFPPGDPVTTDRGCPAEVQEAEDVWRDALGGGGVLRAVGDGRWLLLSVDVPDGAGDPPATVGPVPTQDPQVTVPDPDAPGSSDGVVVVEEVAPGPSAGDDPDRPAASPAPVPADGTGEVAAPVPDGPDDPSPEPSPGPDEGAGAEEDPDAVAAPPPAPAPAEPSVAPAPGTGTPTPLAGFTAAAEVAVGGAWPDGGQLFAPTLRAGLNEGYDRVVVDLTGTGTPGWRAAYPGTAVRDGSGLPAGVAGDSVLEVVLTGMAYPEPGDPVYDAGDAGLDTHTLDGVVEVLRTTPFEGRLQLFVGITGEPRPYRVFLLQDPMRLVVDVQHVG